MKVGWWLGSVTVFLLLACGGGGDNGGPADVIDETGAQDAAGDPAADATGPEGIVDPETGCLMLPKFDPEAPWPAEGQCGNATQGCKLEDGLDLTGRYYRIDHLYVDSPKGPTDENPHGALAATLANLWNLQISRDELVILFHVKKHDLATGEIEVEVGSGMRNFDGPNKCKYQFVANPAPEPMKLKLDGCSFSTPNGPDGKPMYGIFRIYPDLITSPIPVVNMVAHGAFSSDGARLIQNGCLAGGICVDAAKKIDFKIFKEAGCQNFNQFMVDFEEFIVKSTGLPCADGTGLGYEFKGRFDATWLDADFLDQKKSITRDFSCE